MAKSYTFVTREWCIEQNQTFRKSLQDISKEFGMCESFLYKKFKQFGITIRKDKQHVQEKRKRTNFQKYGTEYAQQSAGVKEKIKQTNLQKYGIENPMQSSKIKDKVKQTCLDRYGVRTTLLETKTRQKIKQTCLSRYGVESPLQSKEIYNKTRQSHLKKHGTLYPLRCDSTKEKFRQTCLNKYGYKCTTRKEFSKDALAKLEDVEWLIDQHHTQQKSHSQIANLLGVSTSCVSQTLERLDIVAKKFKFSKEEKEIYNYIQSIYNKEILQNIKNVIAPLELDLFLPEKNLAIEHNGLFWHSFQNKETPKDINKHLQKTEMCEEKGIQLLHIFSNEWNYKQEIVKSIIAAKLNVHQERIFARKCLIQEVDSKRCQLFLDNNHIQGSCSAKINVGLLYNDQLISLMTFAKPRFNKKYEWELIRFCNKLNTKVIGAAGKLLQNFIKTYKPASIISYADRRYSTGGLYDKLGFHLISKSRPNYFYLSKKSGYGIPESRIKYQKHKLQKLLPAFDPLLNEAQNMFDNNYRRIWDCGNLVFELLL